MSVLSKLCITPFILFAALVTGCQPQGANHVGSFVSKAQTSSLPPHQSNNTGTMFRKPNRDMIPAPVRLNQLQRSNTYYNLMMSDPNHGYRSGFMANHFLMQATNDKGNTWYPMALPTSWAQNILAPGNGQLENPSVQVVDNSSFYVFSLISKSLVVWTTTNSGKQFHVRRIPLDDSFQLQSVSTPGMNDAYVLLRATGKRPRPIELVHLTQGGAHVQILHLTQSHFGLGLLKNAQAVIAFTSDSRGKIAATTPDGHLYLFQTTDGGQTWRHRLVAPPQALNGSKAVHVYQPKQLGPETTFVARYVASKAGSPAIKTVVYHSADYGQHYSATLADRLDQAVADYMGTPVRFINPSYGITIADGRMLLTTDAGHSWKTLHTTVIEQTLRDYPRVLGIDYLTVNSIFVVLQSRDYRQTVCYRSTDSGLTFQKMREM